MASQLSIYNMALGLAQSQGKLTSLTDNVREAELCNLFWEQVRDNVCSTVYWSSLRSTSSLVLIAERDFAVDWADGDPSPAWGYAYRLPTDFLRARYLSTYLPFGMEIIGSEVVLQANDATPILTYTARRDVSLWEPSLVDLVSKTLALHIVGSLSSNRSTYLTVREQWQASYISALEVHANLEQNQLLEVTPDWIAARDGDGFLDLTPRYIYPTVPLTYATNPALA